MFFRKFPTTLHYNNILLTDITSRFNLSPFNWENTPNNFYDYVYTDSDTLYNIAAKYYNDSYLYWIIPITNSMINPNFDLPLNNQVLTQILDKKYKSSGGIEYCIATPHPEFGYRKLVSTANTTTNKIVKQDYFILDKESYDNTKEYTTEIKGYKNENFLYSVKRMPVLSIFDHEYQINEQKRNIKILKNEYVSEFIEIFNIIVRNING